MPTVVDALLVTLGLDSTQFKKGAAEVKKAQADLDKSYQQANRERERADKKAADAQKQRAKDIEAYGKATSESFSRIRNAALGLAAVFAGGLGILAFTRDTIGNVAALGRLSTVTGISVGKLAALGLAYKEIGGNAQEANAAILRMSNDLAESKVGYNAHVGAFLRWGGNVAALKDTQSYLYGVANLLHQIDQQKGGAFAWMVGQQMGLDFNTFQILKQGGPALEATIARNEKLTGVTAAAARQAQIMQQKWADLTESLQQTGRTILFTLAPLLEDGLKLMQKWADWAVTHKATIRQWVDEAVTAVKSFIAAANEAAQAVGGWKNVLLFLLGLKVLSAVAPLLSLAGALAKVGKGLATIASSGDGALGILGKLTTAGFLSAIALEVAKMLGLPDTNKDKGREDLDRGDWWAASFDMPAGEFLKEGWKALTGQRAPRGIRNNNPGNIRYGEFAKQYGATGKDGAGFAIFPSMDAGRKASEALLSSYVKGGNNTIQKIISRWAPSSDNNNTSAYIGYVSRTTGIPANAPVGAAQIPMIADAMFRLENGAKWWGAQYAQNMPRGAQAGRWRADGAPTTSNTNIQTTIGQITVNTNATDAQGIAQSIGPAIRGTDLLAMQANTGLR